MKAREALVSYFNSRPLTLPTVASAPTEKNAQSNGTVALPAGEGMLILRDAHNQSFRLQWNDAADGATKKAKLRSLPPGTYDIVTQRFVKRSKDGTVWHTSSTKERGRTLKVSAGEQVAFEASRAIQLTRGQSGSRLMMNVQSKGGAGLSIYKDGKRIPIGYKLLDRDGDVHHEGAMRYG